MTTEGQNDDQTEPEDPSQEVGSSPVNPKPDSAQDDQVSSTAGVDGAESEALGVSPAPSPEDVHPGEEAPNRPIDSAVQAAPGEKKRKKKRSGDNRGARSAHGLTPLGFALRFMAAIALVFGTYNPSGNSYYHWVSSLESADLPAKILTGLLVLVGWFVFFRATSRSLGPVGALLAAAVCGVALWWLIDLNVVAQSMNAITYAVLFIVSVILTLGLTGSFVWRRLTGQYHVDSDDGSMED